MNIRKMDLVVALYIFGVLTSELLGSKTFRLLNIGSWHWTAPVAIFVTPLLFTLIDSVVEVHGRQRARSIVYSGLAVIALLILYASLATHLTPTSRFAGNEKAYDTIFNFSVRIAAASLTAYAVSELMDVAIFARLRQLLKGRDLWLRNNLTNFTAQFFDSSVFLTLAFYATGESLGANVSFLWSLILPYWLLRCGLSIVETPLVYLGVWWLKGPRPRPTKPTLAHAAGEL